jgi:hypothetical protein
MNLGLIWDRLMKKKNQRPKILNLVLLHLSAHGTYSKLYLASTSIYTSRGHSLFSSSSCPYFFPPSPIPWLPIPLSPLSPFPHPFHPLPFPISFSPSLFLFPFSFLPISFPFFSSPFLYPLSPFPLPFTHSPLLFLPSCLPPVLVLLSS